MGANEHESRNETWENHWRSRLPEMITYKHLLSEEPYRKLLSDARKKSPAVFNALIRVLLETHHNGCPVKTMVTMSDDQILLALGVGSLGYDSDFVGEEKV